MSAKPEAVGQDYKVKAAETLASFTEIIRAPPLPEFGIAWQ